MPAANLGRSACGLPALCAASLQIQGFVHNWSTNASPFAYTPPTTNQLKLGGKHVAPTRQADDRLLKAAAKLTQSGWDSEQAPKAAKYLAANGEKPGYNSDDDDAQAGEMALRSGFELPTQLRSALHKADVPKAQRGHIQFQDEAKKKEEAQLMQLLQLVVVKLTERVNYDGPSGEPGGDEPGGDAPGGTRSGAPNGDSSKHKQSADPNHKRGSDIGNQSGSGGDSDDDSGSVAGSLASLQSLDMSVDVDVAEETTEKKPSRGVPSSQEHDDPSFGIPPTTSIGRHPSDSQIRPNAAPTTSPRAAAPHALAPRGEGARPRLSPRAVAPYAPPPKDSPGTRPQPIGTSSPAAYSAAAHAPELQTGARATRPTVSMISSDDARAAGWPDAAVAQSAPVARPASHWPARGDGAPVNENGRDVELGHWQTGTRRPLSSLSMATMPTASSAWRPSSERLPLPGSAVQRERETQFSSSLVQPTSLEILMSSLRSSF